MCPMCGQKVHWFEYLPGVHKCMKCFILLRDVRVGLGRKALCLYLVYRDMDELYRHIGIESHNSSGV